MADLAGSDQFAIYTGSDHKKITADQLSQNYDGSYANYKLAVYNSSNGNHYSVKCGELKTKINENNQSDYQFMISRGSTLYKVSAEKVLGLLGIQYPSKSTLYKAGYYTGRPFNLDKSVSTVDRTQDSLVMLKNYAGTHTSGFPGWIHVGPRSQNNAVASSNAYLDGWVTSDPISTSNSQVYDIGTSSNMIVPGQNTHANQDGLDITYASFLCHPGYLDVVTWTGNNTTYQSARDISHNLEERPGMVWIFSRWAGNHNGKSQQVTWWHQDKSFHTYITNATDTTISTYGCNYNNTEYMAVIWGGGSESQGGNGGGNIKCGSFNNGDGNQEVTTGFETNFIWAFGETDYIDGPWIVVDELGDSHFSTWTKNRGFKTPAKVSIGSRNSGFYYYENVNLMSDTVYYMAI